MRVAFALIATCALFAAPRAAVAQEPPLAKLYACADIADAGQRLACFDGAIAGLKQADASGDVAVVSRQQVQKVEKEAFGLSVPSVADLAASAAPAAASASSDRPNAKPVKPAKPKPLSQVTLAVKSIQTDNHGEMTFIMENGQVWKKIDTGSLGAIGKGPWTAEIRKASFGSYMLTLGGGNRSARVKRIE